MYDFCWTIITISYQLFHLIILTINNYAHMQFFNRVFWNYAFMVGEKHRMISLSKLKNTCWIHHLFFGWTGTRCDITSLGD